MPSPDDIAIAMIETLKKHIEGFSTNAFTKGLKSEHVSEKVNKNLSESSYLVETGKSQDQKIHWPEFISEKRIPTIKY